MWEGFFRILRGHRNSGAVDMAGTGDAGISLLRLEESDRLHRVIHNRLHVPLIRQVIQVQTRVVL